MSKFKVGDRVRPLDNHWSTVRATVIETGADEAKIKPDADAVYITGDRLLSGYYEDAGFWDDRNLELIESARDPVTAPAHYTAGGIECIDAIRAALTAEEFRGYCKGNVIKYAWREAGKGGDEDLRKAAVYAAFATDKANG